ncbi:hypothetical protein [Vibrio navarrensis]|uniref:hypothetical protein n=1 Tax=Vibrio navarrensis TaxID=29495 RepID=UPI0013026116|nr:hypothetical protein [Vibrio navarrensis]
MKESKVIAIATTLPMLTSEPVMQYAGSKIVNLENISTMKIYWNSSESRGDLKINVYDKDGVDGTDDKYIYSLIEGDIMKLMINESKVSFC